ncbi:hypothetical protein NLW51_005167 [Escherichia coli]|nr:hypothetical protein [Escherichia coli]EIH05497.1 hypothetical protein EC50588_A0237 [Escherichia coli 5.0588]EFA6422054.1 hypothetical protein [Escherichia coli]EFA6422056.1 hypothetical protein [Escherichia coli]EFI3103976.1 hypothetical protein [Escherichia coli]
MKVFLFKSERIQEKTGADDEKNITGGSHYGNVRSGGMGKIRSANPG